MSLPKVLMVASEAMPFAKAGNLADVVGSLTVALKSLGHEVAVLLPRYRSIELKRARRVYDNLPIWLGPARHQTSVYLITEEVPFYFVDCPPLFDRDGLYGSGASEYADNHIRFAVLARAALALCRHIFRPDILHCHDWQTGLAPAYLHSMFAYDPTFIPIKTLFTIHHLGSQGLFPPDLQARGAPAAGLRILREVGLDASLFHPKGLEFFGKVSFMKAGLYYSDVLNTVSPTYAREIQTPECGCGLDGVLRERREVLWGILNGVDYGAWNPETDPYIAANYSALNLAGKAACKRDLLGEFGLPPEAMDRPLAAVLSRLTTQNGADLVAETAASLVADGFSLVAMGAGEPEYEERFRNMAASHPDRVAARIGCDNRLAHKIVAGADLFLMPSRCEPCGLNQIYSLRYGTVPVVRATGGLDDTIEEETGFKFYEYSSKALWSALRAARRAFAQPERWKAMMRCGMKKDFSWNVSAAAYASLYQRLLGRA